MAYLSYNHFEVQVIVLVDCVKLASDTWKIHFIGDLF